MNDRERCSVLAVNKWSDSMRESDWSSSNSWSSVDCVNSSWNSWSMVSNKSWSVDCVSNCRNMMSKRSSVSNNWSSVNSMSNRSMVSKRSGMNCMSYSWNMMRSMDSMMRNSMDSMSHDWGSMSNMSSMRMRNWSRDMNSWVSSVDSVGEDWFRERFTILINLRLGEEWIEKRISIECIELGSLVTVDCVPGFTSEEMLIKQSSIGTDESSSVRSMSSILTHTVSLTP